MNEGEKEWLRKFGQGMMGSTIVCGALALGLDAYHIEVGFFSQFSIPLISGGVGFFHAMATPFSLHKAMVLRHLQFKELRKRIWALETLDTKVAGLKSIGRLNAVEKAVEEAARLPIQYSNAEDTTRQIAFHLQVTKTLQGIALRKAELARQRDGELLAGETAKAPLHRSHSAYRMPQITNRISGRQTA